MLYLRDIRHFWCASNKCLDGEKFWHLIGVWLGHSLFALCVHDIVIDQCFLSIFWFMVVIVTQCMTWHSIANGHSKTVKNLVNIFSCGWVWFVFLHLTGNIFCWFGCFDGKRACEVGGKFSWFVSFFIFSILSSKWIWYIFAHSKTRMQHGC